VADAHKPVMQREVVVVAGDRIEVVTEALAPLAPDFARVALHYVGICHSDIAAIASGELSEASRLGHEASGIVVESNVPGVAVGARVVAYADDAYSTYVDVPAHRVAEIDKNCTLLDAALAEPVACVIGAIEMLELTNCDEIIIVGAGFMGLLAVRYLALLGHEVTVVEPIVARRERAKEAGAARAFAPDEAASHYSDGLPVVIEATGGAAGLELASSLVAIGGTLGIMGYHQSAGGRRNVPMERWNYRAMSVLSLHHRSVTQVMRWIDRAQRSAAQGGIVPSDLVDARIELADAGSGLKSQPAAMAPLKAVFRIQGA